MESQILFLQAIIDSLKRTWSSSILSLNGAFASNKV
jgi:hypothetical protein